MRGLWVDLGPSRKEFEEFSDAFRDGSHVPVIR